MEKYEQIILRWVCLFDEFKEIKYSNLKDLVCSDSFQEFVNNVFCFKCSTPTITEDEKLYNTIKANYQEFEIEKCEDLYNVENSVYICVMVLLHALLKCPNNKFREQLSERMDNEEQVLLAKYLATTQTSLFTKKNISEALLLANDVKLPSSNDSEIYSNDTTPIKSKSMQRSYLQEFCESPKSQSLIYQEKEKLIAKLNEEYKNECEENYKLVENVKALQDLNTKLSNKLEDKDKIITILKDEIEEYFKSKESDKSEIDTGLVITKLNQDILDLEFSNNELKQQIKKLENKYEDLNGKFEKKTSDHENLLFACDNIEAENMSLKETLDLLKNKLEKKDIEIISLKDELCNKSISNGPMNSSCLETNVPSNTLFDELNCLKLEEVTHDKEKYRHKYKSVKKDLLNVENHVKDLDEQIITLKQQFHDCEMYKDKLIGKLTDKKKELQECQKKNNNFEIKIKHLKDSIKAKDSHIESVCTKLDRREKQIKELSIEMDSVKKAKTMIELILTKTNTEIEALHEENNKYVNNLQDIINDYKKSEEQSHKNIIDLENNIEKIKDDLTNKENVIIFYEEKMAENYQTINVQEEQLKTMYEEKLMLESHLKNIKTEIRTQEQMYNNKNREMENCLEYHLDELKDSKNKILKIEEILQCKQNEIDGQFDLIKYQKSIIETLQSEKCNIEISIKNLNDVLEHKSIENVSLKEKAQEFTLNLNTLKEKLNAALNEKIMLEKNIKMNEIQIKSSNDEFQRQIYDMRTLLDDRNNEINWFKVNIETLNDDLEKKQNDFTEQLIISNNQIETISQLRLEKYELAEKLKSSSHDLADKENEIKLLEDKVIENELKIGNLIEQTNLKLSENNFLIKNLNMVTSTVKNMQDNFDKQYLSIKIKLQFYDGKIDSLTANLLKLKEYLLIKNNELETQIDLYNKQKENVLILETEKLDLFEKSKVLDQCLLNKDTEIISLEKELQVRSSIINDLEEQLGIIRIEKVMFETNLIETTEQFKKSQEMFTGQINNMSIQKNKCDEEIIQLKNQSLKIENILETKQKELDEQLKLTLEQYEIVNNMKLEKEILEEQIFNANKHSIISHNEIKSLNEKSDEFKSRNVILEKELDLAVIEKTSLETKLNDAITENKVINQKLGEQIKELNNYLRDSTDENNDLKTRLAVLKNDLNQKHIQFEHITKEYNKLRETVDYTENRCIDLQDQLNNLNGCIIKKEEDIKLLEIQNAKYSTANDNLKEQVIELKQVSNNKHVELENQIQWCNEQRETIIKLNCDKESNFNKIKSLEDNLSHKDYQFNLCEGKLYDCSNTINNLEQKLDKMKNEKSSLELQLNETGIQLTNSDKKIALLNLEKDNLLNETNMLNSKLLNKDNVIASNSVKLLEYEDQNNKMKSEKIALEIELNKTINQLENKRHDFERQLEELRTQKYGLEFELSETIVQLDTIQNDRTQQLEITQNKLQEVQEKIIKLQVDLEEQTKYSNEQLETINTLTNEKCKLVDEINALKEHLFQNENALNKLNNYDKHNKEVKLKNTSLMLELNQLKCLFNNLRQESIEQFIEMNKKLCEAQEHFSLKQFEIKKKIELKNDSLTDIYEKLNDLKNIKNELELVFKKEKTEFDTCLKTSLLSCINNKPIHDSNQDSLMEVITSADTFIEQNGIQLIQVENYNEYTIIEKLKKLFEALKMFIININTRGNEQAIIHTNNEYVSTEKYNELLAKSNIQLETIQQLETEMSKLKAECNYKMSKVQQKTQEYVTSEYEKKFERKREQMKQFCKDLETKIHQDYDAKLMKYKEKINKDEMHIKELGQQLWEVSDKYLRLQQKERRESTMSLPFEMSTISQTTTNTLKFNSFTLPKSSSASQIRSLVEETTRSYLDNSKRNVPSGIGKKFSLSSGKIFPKEEDEEGEMFNHSCLADLKQGRVRLNDNNGKQYTERLSELQARNSLCPPHLRSSYTVETSYLPNASLITEEDIKTLTDYSDCESENLIPNDRNKKKDRNQTSYKKPGPPTPSKNGGRVSLSGNAKITLKESKETNTNKRRTSNTPNKLFNLFKGKK